jgi:hypothetical protein
MIMPSPRYPIAYAIVIVPVSITRWIGFKQEIAGEEDHVSSAAKLFAITIFALSGLVNVLLFLITRPNLLLFGEQAKHSSHP